MPDSDVRVYMAELKASQLAQEQSNKAMQEAAIETNVQLASVAKELHGLSKVFAGQIVKVDKLEATTTDHAKRLRTVEDIATAEESMKEIRGWALKTFVALTVSALFYLIATK